MDFTDLQTFNKGRPVHQDEDNCKGFTTSAEGNSVLGSDQLMEALS